MPLLESLILDSALNTQHCTLNTHYCTLNTQHSTLNTPHILDDPHNPHSGLRRDFERSLSDKT